MNSIYKRPKLDIRFYNLSFYLFYKLTETQDEMERQISISNISAVFTKDFDTFGKMVLFDVTAQDPFVEFKLGKNLSKTEVASDMGKEPKWTASINLTFFDEEQIEVTGYEADLTENEYMGTGFISLKSLKDQNEAQSVELFDKEKKSIGKVHFKYVVTKLKPSPLLFVKNIVCQFDKENKFLLKAKPYIEIVSSENKIATQKKDSDAKRLEWKENLRVRLQDGEPVTFNLLDAEDSEVKLFSYEANYRSFQVQKGSLKFNVNGPNYEPLGTMCFDFETENIVDAAQSIKNQQKMESEAKEITQLEITKIKGSMKEGGNDIYFKILVGSNMVKTKTIDNSSKDFTMEEKYPFYAESTEQRVTFAAFDENMINDEMLGVGFLSLRPINAGDKTIHLKNKEGKQIGSIVVSVGCKKVKPKTMTISNIHLKTDESSDIISKQDPYVIFRIGGWSCRTETGEGKDVKYSKKLQIKYSNEKVLEADVWQEDLTKDDKLGYQHIDISNWKGKYDQKVDLLQKDGEAEKKIGTLAFTYEIEGAPEKQSEKLISEGKLPAPEKKKVSDRKISEKSEKNVPSQQQVQQIQQPITNVAEKPKQHHNPSESHNQSMSIANNQSNHAFKLPQIGEHRNFGDRIYDKQSSATLQKSILVYSMPKGQRFNSGPKYSGEPSYYVDTCFKPSSSRGVGFGFGNKRQFPEWMERNMKENPAPGSYFDQGNRTEFRSRGPTFGISHKFYEKVTIPKEVSKQKSFVNKSSARLKPLRRNG